MWEPVVRIFAQHLLLVRSVRVHAPDLHVACPLGVEIDVSAVGREFGAIVEARCNGELGFIAAGCGNRVNVEVGSIGALDLAAAALSGQDLIVISALACKDECFAVRGPAVPVGRGAPEVMRRGAPTATGTT